MPRRFFKHISRKRHLLHNRWFMRPFRALLENPAYWSIHRTNVTRAVAIALFVSFIPLPIHTPTVTVLALLLQVNLPVAVATVYVSNPLTIVPQFYMCYVVGSRLLGTRVTHFHFELSWHWISTEFLPIWKPFLLGCFVMGLVAAVSGYLILRLLWHFSLVMKYHERKRTRRLKTP